MARYPTYAEVHGIEDDADDFDPTPCCPNPGCPSNPCTFPGYAANH